MASAGEPAAVSASATLLAVLLVKVKTMARLTLVDFTSIWSRVSLLAASVNITDWPMRATVVAGGVTSTRAGSRSRLPARAAMAVGMVAENSSVWRSVGSMATA